MWYQIFFMYIQKLGFVRSWVDQSLYSKKVDDHFIYLALYVDDILLDINNMDVINEVKL